MNSSFQNTNNSNHTPQISKNNIINNFKYDLYQCKNERIYTLVNKVSGQIDYVLWQKSKEDTVHIFNGFEAGSVKAMWNSKNRDDIFIRDLSLQKRQTQQLLSQRLKEHMTKQRQKNRELYKPLNENLSDGIYIYTNSKNQEIQVWILSWRMTRLESADAQISPAQKAAITKSIKNYGTSNDSKRLKKQEYTEKWNTISQYNIDLNDPKIDHEIIELFVKIWDTTHWISKQQIKYIIQAFTYYSQFSNLEPNEQLGYLQSNHHIWFLFSGIIAKMKDEKIKNFPLHVTRLHVLKNIMEQWNNQKTQN